MAGKRNEKARGEEQPESRGYDVNLKLILGREKRSTEQQEGQDKDSPFRLPGMDRVSRWGDVPGIPHYSLEPRLKNDFGNGPSPFGLKILLKEKSN